MSDRPETVVLYHADCVDGWAAAWAAWTVFGDAAAYLPVQYGRGVPPAAQTASRLFILDFSYPRETLESLADACDQVIVLDHHQSAALELADLPYARFDMAKSGAVLAWEHFHPGEPVPLLLQYIQDRDLWTWTLPDSREVSAWIATLDRNFSVWYEVVNKFESHHEWQDHARMVGDVLLKSQSSIVDRAAKSAWFAAIEAGKSTYHVPCLNATTYISEIGERLCQLWPESPFSATYFETERDRVWSLRSRGGFDVSVVAKAKGGGGHPGAAGFTERRS